ncbi:hypothetical protein IPM62_01735 [Candidatus Woesebacteria bacterium]|nr:MAG: hypothetical protein IPM62_01735 [Candidatus Woesebacteria bacterium]
MPTPLPFTLTNASSSGTQNGLVIDNAASSGATEALLVLDNSDTDTAVATGLSFVSEAGGITTGIDLSDTDIVTALDLDANFLLFDGVRMFESTTGTLTFEDTSGNDLMTITDNANVGDVNITGNLSVDGTTLGLNDDADTDNVFSFNAASAGSASGDLYWGDDLVCDVSETNCGWTTSVSAFSSWTIADDDTDTYSVVDANILRFTSSDGNILTNLTNGDDGDENLDFTVRLLGDAVAGSGLTGGADNVLVGADGDTTFTVGAGNGITVNADDVAVNQDYDFTFTGNVGFTPAGTDDLTITLDSDSLLAVNQALSGTANANSTTLTLTNASSSGTQNGLVIDNAASSGATEALLVLDNSDTDTAVATGLSFVSEAGGITTGIDLSDTDIVTALDLDANFLLFDGVRMFESTTGTLTFEDTSGNDLMTITDNANVGDVNITGNLSVDGTTLGLNDDADTDNVFGFNAASAGSASGDLYWGDDLVCDVSETNCGWTTVAGAQPTFDNVYAFSLTAVDVNMEIDDASGLAFDLTTTGDFTIEDNGTAFATFLNDGTTRLGQTDYLNIGTTGDLTFVDADGAASITGPAGGALSVIAGTSQAITLTGNATSVWSTTAGDLTLDSAAGSLILSSGENVADSIVISSDTGGIDITTASTEDIDVTGTGGVNIISSEVAADALALTVSGGTSATLSLNSNGTGTAAIDINATGTGGDIDIDANDALTLDAGGAFSIDGALASNVSVTGGQLQISTITSGELDLTSAGLIDINAAANLDIDVTGTFDMLSTGTFSIDGTGASNVTAASGNLTLSTTTTGDVNITSAADVNLTAAGGQIVFANTNVFNIGGITGTAYNAISDSGTATTASSDDDLYIEDILEVDGTLDIDGVATFASTATFADGALLDLSAIIHNDATAQGLKLPQTTALTAITGGGEGYLAWDTDDNKLQVFDGTNWGDVATGGSTEWVLTTNTLSPSSAATDLSIGITGADSLVAPFSVDVSTNTVRIGDGANDTNDPTLTFYASDATNSGSISYLDTDEFNFTGGGINLDNYLDLDSTSTTAFTLGDGTNTYLTFDGSTDAADTLFDLTTASSGITTGKLLGLNADTITEGKGIDLSADALTSGDAIYLQSTSTTLTTGSLIDLEWAPSGSTEIYATGDLFSLNVGQYGNIGNIMALSDNGSDVFTVSQSLITSALPHAFTASGDVSIAYDIVLTNQTTSKIESYGPLTIESGESFENNNLTLKTYGTGDFVFNNDGASVGIITDTADVVLGATDATNIGGSGLLAYGAICADDTLNTADDCIDAARSAGTVYGISSSFTVDDIAENFPTSDINIVAGDVVSLDFNPVPQGMDSDRFEEEFVKKATNTDRSKLIGAISTKPGVLLGGWKQANDPRSVKEVAVALSGRILVNVSSQNGTIEPGDMVTTSSIAGVAAKANQAGMILGTALARYENADPDSIGQILVFINPGYYDPQTLIALDGSGDITIKDGSGNTLLSGNNTNLDLTSQNISLNGNVNVDGELIVDTHADNLIAALSSGENKFVVDNEGNTYVGSIAEQTDNTPETSGNLCFQSTSVNGDPVYQLVECNPNPADLAEWYPVIGNEDIPQAGDIVQIGNPINENTFGVTKSNQKYGDKVIGIVSSQAHQIMGEDVLEWADYALPVALAGRVPVKIDPASDEIHEGDRLASSDVPGMAMKANQTGYSIGSALEKWDPANPSETILVFIDNSVNLSSDLANNSPSNQESITIDNDVVDPSDTSVSIESIENLLLDIVEDQNTMKSSLGWEMENTDGDVSISNLGVENIYVTGLATVESLSINKSLVLGNDIVISATISESTGNAVNAISTLDAPLSIQATGTQPLYLMAGKVNIDTEGNVTIAGNLEVEGQVTAQEVTTDKLTISNADIAQPVENNDTVSVPEVASAESSASIGSAIVLAGTNSVEIKTKQLTQNSLIYITPTSSTLNKVLYVKGKLICEGSDLLQKEISNLDESGENECTNTFVVGIDGVLTQDIEFNWWIVDALNE